MRRPSVSSTSTPNNPPSNTTAYTFPPAELSLANAQLKEWSDLLKKGKSRTITEEKRMNDLWEAMTSNSIGS